MTDPRRIGTVHGVKVADLLDAGLDTRLGELMYSQMMEMFPICRSITGDGVRATLSIVGSRIPLERHEVPSGTPVYDWEIPPEWTVRSAHITSPDGERVVDFENSNLHLVSYSEPIQASMSLAELRPHLYSLPDLPNLVPYRTAYYSRTWGFCLTHEALQNLRDDGEYEVVVDTTLAPGSLTYGECVLPGESEAEVLLSTHVCHPSMANDNLTGIALLTTLGQILSDLERRYTYRLVFVPGTIGSLAWLSRNQQNLHAIEHGLVLTGLGGPGPLVYKRSRRGDRPIDRSASLVVGRREGEVRPFSPWGYDERQYNSPGFDLPVGRLTRTPHGEYPEYHTSGDNLQLVGAEPMQDALTACLEILDVLESDACYLNLSPKGEPQLGKRGLYPSIGGQTAQEQVMAMLWLLNQSDGSHSLLDVAQRSDLAFAVVRRAADTLIRGGLLAKAR